MYKNQQVFPIVIFLIIVEVLAALGGIASMQEETTMSDITLIGSRFFNIFVYLVALLIFGFAPNAVMFFPSVVLLLNCAEIIAVDWLYLQEQSTALIEEGQPASTMLIFPQMNLLYPFSCMFVFFIVTSFLRSRWCVMIVQTWVCAILVTCFYYINFSMMPSYNAVSSTEVQADDLEEAERAESATA